ncbi:MAG: putative transporter [Bacteroidetes bacterium]|nr:putative transporter [Bacteroidota bacterium]
MNWFLDLFQSQSIAQTVVIYGLVISTGIWLGKLKIFGVSLGVTWVLFVGIIVSALGLTVHMETEHFLKEFGLVLFVYAIGLLVGPGFFVSLKKSGLPANLMATAIVGLGICITLFLFYLSNTDIFVMTGIMSGAVTNTPGLGAAQASLSSLNRHDVDASLITLAYAVAYPFGVFGIIASFLILKKIFKIDIERENELHRKLAFFKKNKVVSIHLTVENKQLEGQKLSQIFDMIEEPIVVSRMMHKGEILTPRPTQEVSEGDTLLVVTQKHLVPKLKLLIGDESHLNLKAEPESNLVGNQVVVTRKEVTHNKIGSTPELYQHNFTLVRVKRAGIEMIPHGNLHLQLGDVVRVVGTETGVAKITSILGNSLKKLETPDLAPIFFGIVLGIILGSIPIAVPNIPVPVKIGMAGGPLIASLLLSRYGNKLYLNNYTTFSVNMMMRELGIALFLASVGLGSGHNLLRAFTENSGWYWIFFGVIITIVPLLLVGYIAKKYFKKTFFEVCGLLAGASTDPPALNFAIKLAGNDIPSATYATVYPLTMILRIIGAQLLILMFS